MDARPVSFISLVLHMVPLDPPPLIKGSSNECRESGQRGLGQMNAYSENDCPVAHRKTK